jgi:ubiquinone/menaquinone biosynthesis C-methylase UbiE
MSARSGVPSYDLLLRATHQAFAQEFGRSIRSVPLRHGSRLLDMACGDGFFTRLLARRVGAGGYVTACDLRPAYLARARRRLTNSIDPDRRPELHFALGDAYRLPFDDCSFDVVWCAQSFISLDDPLRALRELVRVTSANGHVAVLENDEFHQMLLPWPLDLEVGLARAIRRANRSRYGDASKTAVARKIPAMFAEAQLVLVKMTTFSGDRWAPFDHAVERFLHCWFDTLVDRTEKHLLQSERAALEAFVDPNAPGSLWKRPNAELSWLSTLYVGQRMDSRESNGKQNSSPDA